MIYERAIKKSLKIRKGESNRKSTNDRRYNGQKEITNELQKLHRKLKIV